MPLPNPDRRLLGAPPLQVALAQARFTVQDGLARVEAGRALLEQLAPLGLSNMTQIHQQQLLVVPASSADQVSQDTLRQPAGWQFAAKDGSTSLTILTDQITLEARQYGGWDIFRGTWQASIAAVLHVSAPGLLTRLGLRYVNRITPRSVRSATDFKTADLVDPTFLGPAVDSTLSEFVEAAEGRATLSFPDGTDSLIHHGIVMDGGSLAFVLDIDCFRSEASPFVDDSIMKTSNTLNERALQVFQAVVRPALRAEMENSEVTP